MKSLKYLTCIILCGALFACDKSDGNEPESPEVPETPAVADVAYVLCQGNFYNGVAGGLYAFDFDNGIQWQKAFETANGRSLGDTPQCGVCYGGKIYLGIYASNTIEVIDKTTFKSIKQLSLANSSSGSQPRSAVAYDGKVYFAMYDGYVCRMDTTSLELEASVKVGPNPEVMCEYQGKLYVPNSDGMSYPNYGKTASVVDLNSFTAQTIEVPENPYQFDSNETGLYLLSKGNYEDSSSPTYLPSAIYKYNGSGFDKIAEATIMGLDNRDIYYVNDPFYGSGKVDYMIYNPDTKKSTVWDLTGIEYASNVVVDRAGRSILVSSLVRNGQYPSYDAPGYICRFSMTNELLSKYNIGAGPTCIFFNYE